MYLFFGLILTEHCNTTHGLRFVYGHQRVCSFNFFRIILSILKCPESLSIWPIPSVPKTSKVLISLPCHAFRAYDGVQEETSQIPSKYVARPHKGNEYGLYGLNGQCDNHASNIRKVLVSQNGFRLLHRNRSIELQIFSKLVQGKIFNSFEMSAESNRWTS